MISELNNLLFKICWLLSLIYLGFCQKIKTCETGTTCTPLSACPDVIFLARSTDPIKRRKFRDAVCDYTDFISVCCTEAPPKPPTEEELLPKDCGSPPITDKIFGGTKAPFGAYPWMVALIYRNLLTKKIELECGAAVINERYALTAAHCLDTDALEDREFLHLRLGDWDLSTPIDCEWTANGRDCAGPSVDVGYDYFILHANYSKRALLSDDIALIRFNRTIELDSKVTAPIHPICIPPKGYNTLEEHHGREAIATGWGFTEIGRKSDILLRVQLPFADGAICKRLYKDSFIDQLCVGGNPKQDTCRSDSGGPLILPGRFGPPYYLIGVVSYGNIECGKSPGVYTAVADYRDWILQTMKQWK